MIIQETKVVSHGISSVGLLGVLFVALKLLGIINWSWWWITAPFWGGIGLFLGLSLIVLLIAGLAVSVQALFKKSKKRG